ncbi:MAG: hypothetical protein LUG66_10660 [Clostridiales bacterium]|nr:hypothetical protein [Clostridiales bacterium]
MFSAHSIEGIVASSFNENSIKNLWDFIWNVFKQNDYNLSPDISDLKELWQLMFNIHNKIKTKPKFILITPKTGSKYDSYMQISLDNKIDGEISRVVLNGYKRADSGDIVKKAIVILV